MSREEYEWVVIVDRWLENMKSHNTMASYYQNEMIFADFFSKSTLE